MKKVLKCVKELDSINKSKGGRRTKLIKESEDCVINAISEIAKNCLAGNIPLKECDFKKLKRYKQVLRKISKKTTPKTRKNLIIQRGGFLPLLLPPALGLLASVVGTAITNKMKKVTIMSVFKTMKLVNIEKDEEIKTKTSETMQNQTSSALISDNADQILCNLDMSLKNILSSNFETEQKLKLYKQTIRKFENQIKRKNKEQNKPIKISRKLLQSKKAKKPKIEKVQKSSAEKPIVAKDDSEKEETNENKNSVKSNIKWVNY